MPSVSRSNSQCAGPHMSEQELWDDESVQKLKSLSESSARSTMQRTIPCSWRPGGGGGDTGTGSISSI